MAKLYFAGLIKYVKPSWYRCKMFHKIEPLKDWYMSPFDVGHHYKYWWKCECGNRWEMSKQEKQEYIANEENKADA